MGSPCSIEGCTRPAVARTWCRAHWKRWRRNGSPTADADRTRIPVDARFWAKVNKDGPVPPADTDLGPCWLWTASTDDWGYGFFREIAGQQMQRAHRVAWSMHVGPIPPGMRVLHRCDNPPCVNYERHLFLGTDEDNVADRVAKGRSSQLRSHHGEATSTRKLSADQVTEIRARYSTTGVYQSDLALEYGVTQSQISRIVRGTRWNVHGDVPYRSFESRRGGRRY